jgi:glycine hydroxymethyltransferase
VKEDTIPQIVDLIDEVLMNIDNEDVIQEVRKKVNDLMGQFPLFAF